MKSTLLVIDCCHGGFSQNPVLEEAICILASKFNTSRFDHIRSKPIISACEEADAILFDFNFGDSNSPVLSTDMQSTLLAMVICVYEHGTPFLVSQKKGTTSLPFINLLLERTIRAPKVFYYRDDHELAQHVSETFLAISA